jgi:hypothetical protein
MCPHKLRPDTARMSADLNWPHAQPAPRERVLFWVYQVATYVTFNVIDDAAMLAFALS